MSNASTRLSSCSTHNDMPMVDVPRILLEGEMARVVSARIVTTENGVLAGCEEMAEQAKELGLKVRLEQASGAMVVAGMNVATFWGNPLQVIRGEDRLLGELGKSSGVATAARRALQAASGFQVVCGAWKKIPFDLKSRLRSALQYGGIDQRILAEPFVYLDKNYLRLFGSVPKALRAAARLPDRAVALQVRGETAPIETEVRQAAELGARVIMVDTGSLPELRSCAALLRQTGLREKVKLAFGGGIGLDDLPGLQGEDLDLVDMGRAIIDAPILDLRYELQPVESD